MAPTYAIFLLLALLSTSIYSSPILSPTDAPLHPLNEVIRGVRVLKRQSLTLASLSNPYDNNNGTVERGFYAFSVLLQSFQTLQILHSRNITSDELDIFTVILNGVLDDTCVWFQSHYSGLDCTDRSEFVAIVLAMGLKPHLRNLDCFLSGLERSTEDQSLEPWINRTFATTPFPEARDLQCQLCQNVTLECCPTASR